MELCRFSPQTIDLPTYLQRQILLADLAVGSAPKPSICRRTASLFDILGNTLRRRFSPQTIDLPTSTALAIEVAP